MKKLFLFIFATMLVGQAWAYDFQKGGLCYIVTSSEERTVRVTFQEYTSYNYSGKTNITIPETVNNNGVDFTVTGIGPNAFYCCKSLTSIEIPNSITSIGEYAFHSCIGLTSITIPNSVVSIGPRAFYNCQNLETIDLPNTLTSIGTYAFQSCVSLTSITIPSSVVNIGDEAFNNCKALTAISVNSNNENYCSIEGILYNKEITELIKCPQSKTNDATIPNTVDSIYNKAFENCTKLTSLTIPNSVISIGNDVFSGCDSLTSITIENGVNVSEANLYFTKDKVRYKLLSETEIEIVNDLNTGDVVIPESVTAGSTFYITTIGPSSYNNITSINIPYSIVNINSGAFENCNEIKTMTINTYSVGTFIAGNTSLETINIGDSVRHIYDNGFKGCGALTTVNIGKSVEDIGGGAFSNTPITSITIPNSVKNIGYGVFYGCESLNSITLPFVGDREHKSDDLYQYPLGYIFGQSQSGTTQTTQSFYYGSLSSTYTQSYRIPVSLKEVVITASSYIPYGAFYNCKNITSISIPNSVTDIGRNAFYGCTSLKSVKNSSDADFRKTELYLMKEDISYQVLDKNFVEVATNTYSGDVEIPETIIAGNKYNVISIGKDAFRNCNNLTSIIIPESIVSIGNTAFTGCSNLTKVSIGNSITSIGEGAFSSCNKLDYNSYSNAYYLGNDENPYLALIVAKRNDIESCEINAMCKIIYGNAFYNCANLSNISIPQSVISIGGHAFSGCTSLQRTEFASIYNLCNMSFYNSNANPLIYSNHLLINGEEITDLVIPDTTIGIGQYAFDGCVGLTSLSIPNSVSSIGNSAFYDCLNIKYLYYNSNANGNYFSDNSSIEKIVIGDSVSNINASTFINCKKLKSVVSFAIVPPTLDGDPFPNADTIYVPVSSVDAYKVATYWKRKEILPFGIVSAKSDNETMGVVLGDSVLLHNNSITITAIPNEGYHFVGWTDGNKDNPRIFNEARNISATASFEAHTVVVDSAVVATCTATGLTEGSHCSVCGEVIVAQNVTPKAEHKAVLDPAIPPTCTESGKTEGSHCSVCGEVFVAQTEIPALGHDFKNYVYNNDATTEADGTETAVCEHSCGSTDTRVAEGTKLPKDNTAVSESVADKLLVYAHGNTIIVENATEEIRVYDVMGRLVDKTADYNTKITVNTSGIYIVKSGGAVKRVMVK